MPIIDLDATDKDQDDFERKRKTLELATWKQDIKDQKAMSQPLNPEDYIKIIKDFYECKNQIDDFINAGLDYSEY
jgi:hypothetical protein